jgi:purine nucleosidase
MKHRIMLDTDPGIDDALALLLALGSADVALEALTTVAGNCPVARCTANAAALLELTGATTIPIAAGADRPLLRPPVTAEVVHGATGLGGAWLPVPSLQPTGEHAALALIRRVLAAPGAITLVAIGPLTNLALALRLEPRIVGALKGVVVMGGALRVPGNVTPAAEFNVYVDPHAAAIAFAAGLPLTLVPLDVTQRVRLTHERLRALVAAAPDSPIIRFISDAVAPLMAPGGLQADGLCLHDPLALAVALQPDLVRLEPAAVAVELTGEYTLGQTVADFPGYAPNIQAAVDVDSERALDLFAERVLRLAREGVMAQV